MLLRTLVVAVTVTVAVTVVVVVVVVIVVVASAAAPKMSSTPHEGKRIHWAVRHAKRERGAKMGTLRSTLAMILTAKLVRQLRPSGASCEGRKEEQDTAAC